MTEQLSRPPPWGRGLKRRSERAAERAAVAPPWGRGLIHNCPPAIAETLSIALRRGLKLLIVFLSPTCIFPAFPSLNSGKMLNFVAHNNRVKKTIMTRTTLLAPFRKQSARLLACNGRLVAMLLAAVCGMSMPLSAQGLLQRVDSVLTTRYRKGGVDTAYVMRPQTNWTVRTRLNVSPGCEELHGPLRPGRPGAHGAARRHGEGEDAEPECLLHLQQPPLLLSHLLAGAPALAAGRWGKVRKNRITNLNKLNY